MLPDYLVLGHITADLLPDGTATSGGTALYAATTAHRLGVAAAVFTAAAAMPDPLPAPFAYACVSSPATTTFANRYTGGVRQQWLHAAAVPLTLDHLPDAWRSAPMVHLGPVLHECALEQAQVFPHALLGVTPQGWMRQWPPELPAPVQRVPWLPAPPLLRPVDLLVLSIEDIAGDEALVWHYAGLCPLVALTRGAAGLTLYVRGVPYQIAAAPAHEVDPTGAGDVFAAAMLVRLYECGDPLAAAAFAARVAAMSVEGAGASAIPTRAAALHRYVP